jgi:hypothetical protein
VKIDVPWLLLALAVLVIAGVPGCSSDLPSCAEGSWNRGRPALLTGAPLFTASQIAPGDPLAIAIPVNEYARLVSVGIRLEDDPDAGRRPTIVLAAEVDGAEIVQLPLEDTVLAPGVYFASSISLHADDFPDMSEYATAEGEASYILSWRRHEELPELRCRSDIPAPTFEVVADSPGGSQ